VITGFGIAVAVRVTVIVAAGFVAAFGDVIATVPVYVPAAVIAAELRLIVSAVEPVPLPGDTTSQLPPPCVVAVAVNGAVGVEALSWMVCGAAVVEAPITWLKVTVVGVTVNVCAAATLTVTGIVIGLPCAPVDVIVTVPEYCPGVIAPAFTDT
jgi:hypothetical protein